MDSGNFSGVPKVFDRARMGYESKALPLQRGRNGTAPRVLNLDRMLLQCEDVAGVVIGVVPGPLRHGAGVVDPASGESIRGCVWVRHRRCRSVPEIVELQRCL